MWKWTTEKEKLWLRQKFKEYKIRKEIKEEKKVEWTLFLSPSQLPKQQKKPGWGTSRFALEGNAIFGQWTWNGEGIKPAPQD